MGSDAGDGFGEVLLRLVSGQDLSAETVRQILGDIVGGRLGEAETAAFLVALRMKGETPEEVAAAAETIRALMTSLDTGGVAVLDTCGTGGDGAGTFNISTAAAFVAAGAGVPVVKHGNRAVSGGSGSADVLTALGVAVERCSIVAAECLETAGLAFCFAPDFHPALRAVAALRRRLGIRTFFNLLGPLANPARAAYQLVGVGDAEWLDPVAGALARLGISRALVVCGADGLDEVSLAGPTLVREVRGGEISSRVWTPGDFGLAPCAVGELRVRGPDESGRLIRSILDGAPGPAARVVLANAAAALVAAGRAESLPEGVARASDAVSRGKARQVLERVATCSRRAAPAATRG